MINTIAAASAAKHNEDNGDNYNGPINTHVRTHTLKVYIYIYIYIYIYTHTVRCSSVHLAHLCQILIMGDIGVVGK